MKHEMVLKRILIPAIMIFLLISISENHELSAGESGKIIKIGGTGGAIGTIKELAAAFQKKHPEVSVVVVPHLGTRGGIKAVMEGAIDIGLAGRSLNPAEIAMGLNGTEYASSPFVFVTSNAAGMNLTLDKIARIYTGEIRQWPDGTQIRLILRPEGDIDTIILKGISPEIEEAVKKARTREGLTVAMTDQDSADIVEKLSGSFGTTTLTQIISEKRHFTVLPLNGIIPGLKTIANGTYPFYKNFTMITGPKPSPVARSFIEFVKSKEGRSILMKTGNNVPKVTKVK